MLNRIDEDFNEGVFLREEGTLCVKPSILWRNFNELNSSL